jgi:DNA-directed RNA polymerase beta subunit
MLNVQSEPAMQLRWELPQLTLISGENFISIDNKRADEGWFEKGTIGILLDGIDMPFNKHGIRPDIILNPNAIPSRMTVGQIVECLVGKAAVLQGYDCDGTPFEDYDLNNVEKVLESLGYNGKGTEELYNGMTGEKMKVKVFFGPTYYQRLKHLVADKIELVFVVSKGRQVVWQRQHFQTGGNFFETNSTKS